MGPIQTLIHKTGDLVAELSRTAESIDEQVKAGEAAAKKYDGLLVEVDKQEKRLKLLQEETTALEAKKARLDSDLAALKSRFG